MADRRVVLVALGILSPLGVPEASFPPRKMPGRDYRALRSRKAIIFRCFPARLVPHQPRVAELLGTIADACFHASVRLNERTFPPRNQFDPSLGDCDGRCPTAGGPGPSCSSRRCGNPLRRHAGAAGGGDSSSADAGNLTDDTLFEQTAYQYDAAGNLSVADHANPQFPIANPSSESYVYDRADRLVSQTDANGATTHYAYNAAGRLQSLTDPVGNGV